MRSEQKQSELQSRSRNAGPPGLEDTGHKDGTVYHGEYKAVNDVPGKSEPLWQPSH